MSGDPKHNLQFENEDYDTGFFNFFGEKNRSFVQIKYLIILHKKNHANDHILGKEIIIFIMQ